MSRREAILARAAALAESSSDDADASTRDVDGVRPLGRRRTFVPLEELTRERKDAPFRPPGDRRAAARAADAGARGTAAPGGGPGAGPGAPAPPGGAGAPRGGGGGKFMEKEAKF